MKFKKISQFLILFLIVMFFILPAFAMDSSVSQTVSVTVPEINAASANCGNSSTINSGPIFPDNTEVIIGNIYFSNPSNVDTEMWIKASGDLTSTNKANTISLSNLKYSISDFDITGEFTDQYMKVGMFKRPEQGSNYPEISIDLKVKVPYGTTPDNYNAIIYITSIKFNSIAPV